MDDSTVLKACDSPLDIPRAVVMIGHRLRVVHPGKPDRAERVRRILARPRPALGSTR